MKRRNAVLTAITALSLLAILVLLGYRRLNREPSLIVHLRCGADMSGKLSAARIKQDGASSAEETFNLADACRTGKIEIGGYQREEVVRFTFERENGEIYKVVSEYGRDIQSDQNGFYTVLKVTENPPFIIKDSI